MCAKVCASMIMMISRSKVLLLMTSMITKNNAVGWGWGVEGAYAGADYVDDSDSAADETGAGEDAAKSVIFQ